MYFESVLLLVSVGIIVPYGCFSLVNSLAQQDFERKYSNKVRNNTTILTKDNKIAPPTKAKGRANSSAIVKVSKSSALVKRDS